MRAKQVQFDVTYINLSEKPDWFLEVSPHGKVPVLSVDERPLFESNAIAEYLDEIVPPKLHPENPIKRARNRAWTDFVPDFSRGLSGIYWTKTKEKIPEKLEIAAKCVAKVEEVHELMSSINKTHGIYNSEPNLAFSDGTCSEYAYRRRADAHCPGMATGTKHNGKLAWIKRYRSH